jgi:integrase
MLLTGLRPNEAATLKWSNVDFERKRVVLKDTKNGTDHVIPMTNVIYALFRHREENNDKSPYVFRIMGKDKSRYITSYKKTLDGICDAAKVDRVAPHDLRRTFATLLNTLGVGFADVKHLMNHSVKDVTTAIYIQPDFNRMRGILQEVGNHYDSCVPFTDNPPEGFSRYALGTLRSYLYGKGAPAIQKLEDQFEEDAGFQEMVEREYWEE